MNFGLHRIYNMTWEVNNNNIIRSIIFCHFCNNYIHAVRLNTTLNIHMYRINSEVPTPILLLEISQKNCT